MNDTPFATTNPPTTTCAVGERGDHAALQHGAVACHHDDGYDGDDVDDDDNDDD